MRDDSTLKDAIMSHLSDINCATILEAIRDEKKNSKEQENGMQMHRISNFNDTSTEIFFQIWIM
jgi:hypothetical protein